MLVASFGTGARLKFARDDRVAAEGRLAEGLEIARTMQLPRLEARLVFEHVRLAARSNEAIDQSRVGRVIGQGARMLDGIGDVTAELTEDIQIRVLLADAQPSSLREACSRARARVDHIEQRRRPRSHLRATIQLALCLASAGEDGEAQRVLAPALRTCAALGLSALISDEGTPMLRLAHDTAVGPQSELGDATTSANVRDFVLKLDQKAHR
jgi:serine/threonine-protein kinase PknK